MASHPHSSSFRPRWRVSICILSAGLLTSLSARALDFGGLPPELQQEIQDQIQEAEEQVRENFTKPLSKGLGLTLEHRAYRPATALGKNPGVEIGVEGTLVKTPSDFTDAFNEASGGSSSSTGIPFLASPKLHLTKGFGETVDLGISALWLLGNWSAGGHLQVTVFNPPEGGLTWAVRMNYTQVRLKQDDITMRIDVLSPQLLVSRQMSFADPYAGIGYQNVAGKLTLGLDPDDSGPIPRQEFISRSRVHNFTAFTGVSMLLGPSGVAIAMEIAYSSGGMPTMGAKLGFRF